jgi:hypothetical protein
MHLGKVLVIYLNIFCGWKTLADFAITNPR